MSPSLRRSTFQVLAALSAAAAGYHVVGALGWLRGDATPVWRHTLFIGIDCIGVWYLLRRPLAWLPLFVVLVGQQYVSHGGRAIRWWSASARIDTVSIGTLLALTVALALLLLDARDRSMLVRRLVCPFGGARARGDTT